MVKTLEILGLVLKIVAALCSIGFTYYQFHKSNKRPKKGSSDAGTSDKPDDDCLSNL